jgi:hypothetical protein
MGIIGTAFKKLFGFLGGLFGTLFGVIWDGVKWLGNAITKLFQNLLDVLIGFFKVIYALIDGLLYLLYMIGVLAVKLFLVIFEAAKVLWSLVVGFGRTLASLHYSPTSGSGNGYSTMMGKIFTDLKFLQIDTIAYILLFALWFVTAVAAIRLVSSIRVGGE